MNVTLITPTGDRPEAFALCERYMKRQTLQPIQWLVYDDGEVPTQCNMGQEYHWCPQFRGKASLTQKIFDAFAHDKVKGDVAAIIEDDDWYHMDYLKEMTEKMSSMGVGLIGEGHAMYYNVAQRWWYEHGNMKHASLCQTVIARSHFPVIADLTSSNHCPFIDVRLWQAIKNSHIFPPALGRRLLVGIKSMPGRKGYGSGHKINGGLGARPDRDMVKLSREIGMRDARVYSQFYERTNNPLRVR